MSSDEYSPCHLCGTALHNLTPDNFCSQICKEAYGHFNFNERCFICGHLTTHRRVVYGAFSRRYCSHTCYEDGERKAHYRFLASRLNKMTETLVAMVSKEEDVAFEDMQ